MAIVKAKVKPIEELEICCDTFAQQLQKISNVILIVETDKPEYMELWCKGDCGRVYKGNTYKIISPRDFGVRLEIPFYDLDEGLSE